VSEAEDFIHRRPLLGSPALNPSAAHGMSQPSRTSGVVACLNNPLYLTWSTFGTDEVKQEKEYPPEHDDDGLICSFSNKK
jgi:hypothetical protein